MARLRAALDAAASGRGSMVLLTGAPGIGKSRLVGELVAEAETGGLTIALGRATPAAAATPFGPLTQALLRLLRGRALPETTTSGSGAPCWRRSSPLCHPMPSAARRTGRSRPRR